MTTNFAPLIAANAQRWAVMQIRPADLGVIDRAARGLMAIADAKGNPVRSRYETVAEAAFNDKRKWPMVAIFALRESNANFADSLAQGDPWNRVSTHVPAGEGPFDSWEHAAVHALVNDDHLNTWADWTIGGILTAFEAYNGLGYYYRGRPSAYVWSMTTCYGPPQALAGKFVADGEFDADTVDVQVGCAAVLARMVAIDPSIQFWGDVPLLSTIATPHPTRAAGLPVATDAPPLVPKQPLTTDHDVTWVQQQLNTLAGASVLDIDGKWGTLTVDGKWGPATKAAVRAYQVKHGGLLDDGIPGPQTDAALEADVANLAAAEAAGKAAADAADAAAKVAAEAAKPEEQPASPPNPTPAPDAPAPPPPPAAPPESPGGAT